MIERTRAVIDGVKINKLKQIVDNRGKVMHMLRKDDKIFQDFGEIYFSTIHFKSIKGWHLHKESFLNYACIKGEVKLVLFDLREKSSSKNLYQEIILSPKNYSLVTKIKDFEDLIEVCHNLEEIAIDTETDSLNAVEANLVGVSIAVKPGLSYYIPLRHEEKKDFSLIDNGNEQLNDLVQVEFGVAVKLLKEIFEDPSIVKIGHNIKYDYLVLSQIKNGSINLYPVQTEILLNLLIKT